MFEGRLVGIVLGAERREPLHSVDEAQAIVGKGLAGDRYALNRKSKEANESSRDITLIEQEALEAARHDYLLELSHVESRRNLLTVGVPLNHLVGRTFQVGEVMLEGVELCEPCKHLERLTGKKAVRPLLHRGGLRARIIQGGTLRVSDVIRSVDASSD